MPRVNVTSFLILGLALLCAAGIAGQQLGFVAKTSDAFPIDIAAEDNVVLVHEADQEMQIAKDGAMGSLETFLAAAKSPPSSWSGLAVKAALEGESIVENIWIANFAEVSPGIYRGQLSNDPVDLPGLGLGDVVEFRADQIVDWAFSEGGRGYGYYTVRALMDEMPDADRAQIAAFLSDTPEPEFWPNTQVAMTPATRESATMSRMFDAMRWGFGFDAS